MQKKIFQKEEILDMINLYRNEKQSLSKIAKKYNVSRGVITRVLKENKIAINKDNHKYKADYRKFQTIDSPEKAYWLGFIAADGCNYEREQNASLIINLHQKDKDHLQKFKVFMDSNVNIQQYIQNASFSNNTPMCRIVFNSKDLSKDLSSKGVVPRKSLILTKPNIEEKYYLPFILGYFDGDDSIYYNKKEKNFGISIEGTKELLEWINSLLNISSHLEKRYHDNSNNYYIRCGGTNKPYLIMKTLYDSVEEHLERKFEIYQSLETVVLNRNIK